MRSQPTKYKNLTIEKFLYQEKTQLRPPFQSFKIPETFGQTQFEFIRNMLAADESIQCNQGKCHLIQLSLPWLKDLYSGTFLVRPLRCWAEFANPCQNRLVKVHILCTSVHNNESGQKIRKRPSTLLFQRRWRPYELFFQIKQQDGINEEALDTRLMT